MINLKSYFHHHLARPFYEVIKPLQPVFKFKKRTFFDRFKVKTKDGVSFWLFNNAFYWDTELFWQGFNGLNYENKTREIWCFLSANSEVIFDIGANTGWFSMMAKAYNRNSEVYAFEPQPNIFHVLKKNDQINDFGVHCEQLALSNEKGSLPFYNTGSTTFSNLNTMHGSLNKEWRTKRQESITVEVDQLENYINKNCLSFIDLIKIDVETLEYEVLQGYGELLFQHRPIVLLEIQNIIIGNKLLKLFENRNFHFFWINEEIGIIKVEELGTLTNQENLNYLICPEGKIDLIKPFLV